MLDGLKMAAKLAVLTVAVAAIVLLLNTITIPAPDFSVLNTGLGKALALGNHWIPGFPLFVQLVQIELVFIVALYVFRFGVFAYHWVLKVNE